jgi:hypothetical protein
MDTSLEEVKNFKKQLNQVNLEKNALFIRLFLVLIEHLETDVLNGSHYLSLLLHNPLNDIPEEDDKNLYKKLISNNSSEIIDLTAIIPFLQSNNSEEIFKKIKVVFENAIFTSSDESPLDYEYSEWFNGMSKNMYRKVKRGYVLYEESNILTSDTRTSDIQVNKVCSIFKSELKNNSPISCKRKHSTSFADEGKSPESIEHDKFNKRIKNVIKSEYFEKKICEIMNCMNWEDFLKEKMTHLDSHIHGITSDVISKNTSISDDHINELIKIELDKKFESFSTNKLDKDYTKKIQDLEEQSTSITEILVKNQILDTSLHNIRDDLKDIRNKTRNSINTSHKTFSAYCANQKQAIEASAAATEAIAAAATANISDKQSHLDKIYAEKLFVIGEIFSRKKMIGDYNQMYTKNQNELNEIKMNLEKQTTELMAKYKTDLNILHNEVNCLKSQLAEKKISINSIFKEYENVKEDVKKRINSMTGFVGDFFTKISAAANGCAITID